MSSIPEEMYREILSRLPVQSILVSKSVCKNWYAVITSSDFVKTHMTIQKDNNSRLMLEGHNLLYSVGHDSLASPLCDIEDDAVEMDYPFQTVGYNVKLLGVSNGLFCLWLFDYEGDREFPCLWNPATGEYKELPKLTDEFYTCSICFSALGYDLKTDDYKFAIGVPIKDGSLLKVYSLASNTWKSEQIVPYRFHFWRKSGVLVNGHYHWLALPHSNMFLLSFDINNERFEEMQLPLEKKEHPSVILGVMEECLCLLVGSSANGVLVHHEIWKMLDYGVRESWTKHYVIAHESVIRDEFILRLVGSSKNGDILFLTGGCLVLYDAKNRSATEQRIYGVPCLNAENYFESLVSLNSGTHVSEDDI